MKIPLDPYSTKLVNDYSCRFLRDPIDVVNGIVSGRLEHAFEERDEAMNHVHDDVLVSAKARTSMKNRSR